MPLNLDTTKGINPKSQKYKNLIQNLQSNILKSHARKHVKLIFIQFTGDEVEVKKWIKNMNVTSAKNQLTHSEIRDNNKDFDGGLMKNFLLTAEGYEELGYDISKFKKNGNKFFLKGMKSKRVRRILCDPSAEKWDAPYQEEIDALIVLADSSLETIEKETQLIKNSLIDIADVITEEDGKALEGDKEHFGFVDGISNTKFYKKDIKDKPTNNWNPIRPLHEVLIRDPFTAVEKDAYGSFMVFRKLSQDIKGFEKGINSLARKLTLSRKQKAKGLTKKEYAEALVIGRFKNGTPLVESEFPLDKKTNNFNLEDDDPKGRKCPFHAHIRKTNPRSDTRLIIDNFIPDRFITRRGIPYGNFDDNKDKGLLFMCYQSNLKKQFNFIQQTWANSRSFPPFRGRPGIDPLIGQGDNGKQTWPKAYDSKDEFEHSFGQYIKLLGGEYFFAPSIDFLKNIS